VFKLPLRPPLPWSQRVLKVRVVHPRCTSPFSFFFLHFPSMVKPLVSLPKFPHLLSNVLYVLSQSPPRNQRGKRRRLCHRKLILVFFFLSYFSTFRSNPPQVFTLKRFVSSIFLGHHIVVLFTFMLLCMI